jgi:hypothetical protein
MNPRAMASLPDSIALFKTTPYKLKFFLAQSRKVAKNG